jgi:addiction module HigA family antidote
VAQRRISEITQGKRSITADTALRLGRYFGMEAQFWLNLQSRYDLLRAETALAQRLEKEVTPHAA